MASMQRYPSGGSSSNTIQEYYQQYCQFLYDERDKKILGLMLLQSNEFTECIVCGASIEQPWFGGRTRRFCDRPGCRKRGNRVMHRFRRWQWEQQASARLLQYWQEALLPTSRQQLETLLENRSRWITTEVEEGVISHRSVEVCDEITRMIENERRAAWEIVKGFHASQQKRAEDAEARIKALEAELTVLRCLLPNALHQTIDQQPRYQQIVDAVVDNPHALVSVEQTPPAANEDDMEHTSTMLRQADIAHSLGGDEQEKERR
jgi:hypothetical protein